MHFDRLDESYAMVKSNMNFGKVTLAGLTGLCIPVKPVRPVMPILVVNICPLFFGKTCVPKNICLDQNCLRAMNTSAIFCTKGDNNLSAVSCFFFKLMTKQLA